MGEVTVLFQNIVFGTPTWLRLASTTGEKVSGEIEVLIQLRRLAPS